MNWILIFVALNIANPQEPAMLAHGAFTTQAACEAKANQMLREVVIRDVRTVAFCIPQADLENSS